MSRRRHALSRSGNDRAAGAAIVWQARWRVRAVGRGRGRRRHCARARQAACDLRRRAWRGRAVAGEHPRERRRCHQVAASL
eukprot:129691-Chlamydomonas_euryale.AAC.1